MAWARRPQRGLSLIEGMVCLAVASVLMAVAAPSTQAMVQQQRQRGESAGFLADFQHARAQALGTHRAVHVGFHQGANGTGYVVHQGPRGACRLDDQGQAQCDDGAHLLAARWLPGAQGVSLQANVARMTVNPNDLTVTPTGSVRVTNAQGQGSQHVVGLTGRVRTVALP